MTLVEALKAHTGCKHKLSKSGMKHGDDWMPLNGKVAWRQEDAVQRGSAMFHDIARWLLSLPGHERHPLHITDEEYASFVEPK